ncbi:hypothetical protein DOY81_010530, partial [Sarcophaga bullata]
SHSVYISAKNFNRQFITKYLNMAFKFIFALSFVAFASAGYIPASHVYHAGPVATVHAAPVAVAEKVVVKSEEYDPHPQYKFSYGVEDQLTGDSKSQVEERDGDVVRGEYSLIDADGYKRTVQYTADPINGFNAVVNREPLAVKSIVAPTVVKTVAPVAQYSVPTIVKTVAPVTHYAAPTVVKSVAPVTHYASPAVGQVAHYSTPAFVKSTAPVAHFSTPYAQYSAPAHYTSYAAPTVTYHH